MMHASLHDPKSVVLDRGSLYQWLTIHDGKGNQVSIHFGESAETAHAFALAVLRAVAAPEQIVDVMPEVK